jgi:trigger factor
MNINVERTNIANAVINAKVEPKEFLSKFDEVAKTDLKHVKLDGFRPGKVPMNMLKKKFNKELTQSVEQSFVEAAFNDGLKEIGVNKEDVLGEPIFDKFDNKDNKLDIILKISLKPIFKIDDYKSCIPEVKSKSVTKKEITDRIKQISNQYAQIEDVKTRDIVKDKDIVVLDFEGFVDKKAFDGGKSTDYQLEIGSKSFIDNFEEQLVGMKIGDKKDIEVSFPKDYQSEELKGKKATFKVQIKSIKEKKEPVIDDKLAQQIMQNAPGVKDKDKITLKILEDEVKKAIVSEKKSEYYSTLKKDFFDKLVSKFGDFALPENILEKETISMAQEKVNKMSEKEVEELKNNNTKIDEIKTSCQPEAKDRVKLTFIVDAIAKKEDVSVSDQQIMQEIYMEAIQTGQDPKATYELYQKNNLIPALKMAIIEEKVTEKLFDQKVTEKKTTKKASE